MNPNKKTRHLNPSYEKVRTGITGHVEVCHIIFDCERIEFKDLCKFFFSFHDASTLNRQGNDSGSEFASYIFAHSRQQALEAAEVKKLLQEKLNEQIITYANNKVVTAIREATKFYSAEEYHQNYLEKDPNGYCSHNIKYGFEWHEI